MDRRADIIRFLSDGWHARFDDGFTRDNVVRVADALGLLWSVSYPGATVYVGYDRRHASADLAWEVAGTLSTFGLVPKVSDTACPTPAVGWACAHDRDTVGAVILTASERSCEYGGMLVRGADGGPVPRSFLEELEQNVSLVPSEERAAFEECDLVGPYCEALASWVDARALTRRRPKVVVDAMYGAATGHLARLLAGLGCEVVEIHAQAREDFGGIHPEPQDPWADACEQAVVAHEADLGVLLDGDGDRAALVDERGVLVPARVVAPLLLGHLVSTHGASGRVVATTTSSVCLSRQARLLGLECTTVPVGFARIYREVLEGDVVLAAEERGGVCVPSHLRERDGMLVCVLAVEMLALSGGRMSALVEGLESQIGSTRYARRDVRLEPAATQAFRNVLPGLNPPEVAGKVPVEVSHADGLQLRFEDGSWVLMRPSRAGSVVRVYAEAASERDRDRLLEAACDVLRRLP